MKQLNTSNNDISNRLKSFENSLFKAIYENVSSSNSETFTISHIDELPGYEDNENDKIFNLLRNWGNIIEEIHSRDNNVSPIS